MKSDKIFFVALLLFFSCISVAVAAASNPGIGQLKIWELNMSNESRIPFGVYDSSAYIASKLGLPDTSQLVYNPSLKSIDYTMTYPDFGELYIGGLYPSTDCNLTFDLGIDRSYWGSDVSLFTSVAAIVIQRRSDDTYRITSEWTDDSGITQYPSFDIPASFIQNNRMKFSLLSYNSNKTNVIRFSDALQVSTPYQTDASRKSPYPVLITPLIQFDMYVSGQDGVNGYETAHIYDITQTINRQTVTVYPTKNQLGFGLDYPAPSQNTKGTAYMQGKGQVGTVWADVGYSNPETVAYEKTLLSQGWELGIHFSNELNALTQQQAFALMDSEYATIKSTYGTAPTSCCCYRNNDSIVHAIYAYQHYGMLWRNGPSGISWVTNVGNLDNDTWSWWNITSANSAIYPVFTHELDLEPANTYAIDYSKFTTFCDRYASKGINVVGFAEYYRKGIAQSTTTINLEESDGNHTKFIPTTNGYPCIVNVKTSFASPQVYANGVAIPFIQTSDGVQFTVSNSVEYVVLSASTKPFANFTAFPTNGTAPLTVTFNDISTGSPTSLNWSFGDGNYSNQKDTLHTYFTPGTYQVNLTVSNTNGTSSKLATINVSAQTALPVFPGYSNPPTDPTHDGLYEDINGNGYLDFDDVVAYYDNMDWIEQNNLTKYFDYNKNGVIDFDDVEKLYDML